MFTWAPPQTIPIMGVLITVSTSMQLQVSKLSFQAFGIGVSSRRLKSYKLKDYVSR